MNRHDQGIVHPQATFVWHPWYAWRPVWALDHDGNKRLRWFTDVERMWNGYVWRYRK